MDADALDAAEARELFKRLVGLVEEKRPPAAGEKKYSMQKHVAINLRHPLKLLLKHLAYRNRPLEGQCGVRLTAWKDDELYVTRAASLELAEELFLEIMRPNEGAGHGNRDTDRVVNPEMSLKMERLRT
uniref:Uncharacterized protein n=1 Tax=Phaeomonas parva TaxID=124430 RepID=A0A7S1XPS3_9STRA|mmetsp:Transcript_22627/g.70100  ORF Transcript_22627/g.70100 Transcript_22627/m.70100 type:complete len:129 (+) Transcript_22627:169-555(+)